MSENSRHGDLEISEDLSYTRKAWRFERIGWCLLALFILAALAGLFGNGPLSDARVQSEDGWWLEYERFGRRVSPLKLTFYLPVQESTDQVRVRIDRQYLDACQIQYITPEPLETRLDTNALVYVFPSIAGRDRVQIVFQLEPQRLGVISGQAAVGDQSPVVFEQLIYP